MTIPLIHQSKVFTKTLDSLVSSSERSSYLNKSLVNLYWSKNIDLRNDIVENIVSGKGNKIINIPSARSKAREEFVTLIKILSPESAVTLHAGKRKLTLKASDIAHYRGERGRRGNKLPRGLQRVDRVEIETTNSEPEVDE